jgi:hypothetical protein
MAKELFLTNHLTQSKTIAPEQQQKREMTEDISHSYSIEGTIQVIMPEGRPDGWFNENRQDGSSQARKPVVNDNGSNEEEGSKGLQLVSSPWYYPEEHQEIIERRPSGWLGGSNASLLSSPQQKSRHTLSIEASFYTPRKRPTPIRIEGYNRRVKDSPFFH